MSPPGEAKELAKYLHERAKYLKKQARIARLSEELTAFMAEEEALRTPPHLRTLRKVVMQYINIQYTGHGQWGIVAHRDDGTEVVLKYYGNLVEAEQALRESRYGRPVVPTSHQTSLARALGRLDTQDAALKSLLGR
jgi:hypothetical protein